MAERVQESAYSFSRERVRRIYLDSLAWKATKSARGVPSNFLPMNMDSEWSVDRNHVTLYSPEQRKHRAQKFARSFYDATTDSEQHVARLDSLMVALLQCRCHGSLDEDSIVSQTSALLSRLAAKPYLPQSIYRYMQPHPLSSSYFHDDLAEDQSLDSSSWQKLFAIEWIDTNTIRMALLICEIRDTFTKKGQPDMVPPNYFVSYVDLVAEILEASFEPSYHNEDAHDQSLIAIAQSFLWTCWCRSLMLHFYWILEEQVELGYDGEVNFHLGMRKPIPEIAPVNILSKKADYMCNWAFEVLRNDRACMTQDFRAFHERFSVLHGQKPGRCVSSHPCDGSGPQSCQRFTGMKIVDQSAHDYTCNHKCKKLTWDEGSYRGVTGARAVSIRNSDDIIRYCQASQRTIAVSHVWAHGAGGRPHTGFNSCLHERLVRLAQKISCDSYWMDTPCIPENHELRAEAIGYINMIFKISHMTLIWDFDLMSIDISRCSSDLQVQESLLCTLLVCDWNLRSWTLLESIRARHNVHILCKCNEIVSLKKCVLEVHNFGAIEIGNLLLTSQQLLPALGLNPEDPNPDPSPYILKRRDGYVTPGEAICLLAYRHASRPGDSTVIMSLLGDETPIYTAEAFWKSKIGEVIYSGILFSSQPRLKGCRGFGWAPAQPEVLTIPTSSTAIGTLREKGRQHILFDGHTTSGAAITAEGLRAEFETFNLPEIPRFWSLSKQYLKNLGRKATISIHSRDTDDNKDRPLRPDPAYRLLKQFPQLHQFRHRLLLLPFSSLSSPSVDRTYRGRSHGAIFAVVGSHDENGSRWHWLGVFEWDPTVPWPSRRRDREEELLLV